MTPLETLCAILRHEPVPWTAGDDPDAIRRFLDAGRYHGVLQLLDAEFARRDGFETWPREILVLCHKSMLAHAVREPAQRAEITRVVDALTDAGAQPLVLKGSALAYSHYPDPALRPRSDTDLLIAPSARERAERALAALGYAKSEGIEGEFVSYQATWTREVRNGIAHHFDVHWRINNSQVLAKAMAYDELAARAAPLPALGAHARALAPVDALLFACIHLAGHVNAPYFVPNVGQQDGDRLIWLYDMHLLYSKMSDAERNEFAAMAAAKKMRALCHRALARAQECFATPVAQHVIDALNAPGPIEPSARYFSGGRARQMLGDFLAFDSWRDRGQWLAEHAFPAAEYMRGKYPDAPHAPLPILYARRLGSGLARIMFSRSRDTTL